MEVRACASRGSIVLVGQIGDGGQVGVGGGGEERGGGIAVDEFEDPALRRGP